jgi:hypothetical protein
LQLSKIFQQPEGKYAAPGREIHPDARIADDANEAKDQGNERAAASRVSDRVNLNRPRAWRDTSISAEDPATTSLKQYFKIYGEAPEAKGKP